MAGHSKFKNIMHRKGAQDRMRAKLFSRLSKEISVAVKLGGNDIDSNFRLKSAISSAKTANVPKDNIMRAIPMMISECRKMKQLPINDLKKILSDFDNENQLNLILDHISTRLISLSNK